MLHNRDAMPHFESGVVAWVGDPELARRGGGPTVRIRVNYDDGASHEHLLDEEHVELECDDDADGAACSTLSSDVLAHTWQRLELKCMLSSARLTKPARGAGCMHLSCCNFDELRNLVGQSSRSRKTDCPVAGCSQKIRLERDIKVDEQLTELLEDVPDDADEVEVRLMQNGYQVRPIQTEAASVPASVDVAQDSERGRAAGGKRKAAVLAASAIGGRSQKKVKSDKGH